jgi:Flp pilus assembly protein TadG
MVIKKRRDYLSRNGSRDVQYTSERGQALVLIALAMTALVGFVALSIDGGMAYAQRREAQNAADRAAVEGTYRILTQKRANGTNQQAIRAVINQAAQAHGVRDTDGSPTNHINGNVSAVFTDAEGTVLGGGCEITSCSGSVASAALGVQVRVNKPFDTFFAGIIGHKQIGIRASALAVIHSGSLGGNNNDLWAVFAIAAPQCGGGIDLQGARLEIVGNAHSNGGFKVNAHETVKGKLTYRNNCHHCPPKSKQVPRNDSLVLPDLVEYRTLAFNQTIGTPSFYNGSVTLTKRSDGGLGTPARPFTYIRGDLSIGPQAEIPLHGLIYVEGDVTLQKDAAVGSFLIVAGPGAGSFRSDVGDFKLSGGISLIDAPYQNASFPILRNNGARFFSGFGYSNGGSGCSSANAMKISGSNNMFVGSLIAPYAGIDISGSNNEVYGSLIANNVSMSGSSHAIHYIAGYFPPQPDRIELLQ